MPEDGITLGEEEQIPPSEGITVITDDAPPDPVSIQAPRGRGRPPGSGNQTKIRFPTPNFRKYNSDSEVKGQRTQSAFNWVNNLSQEFKNRCDWYVYRRHPVMLEPPIDPETRRPAWYKYIDKIAGSDPNPIKEEKDLLDRYGCGRYELYLNETDAARGDEARNILQVYVQSLGGSDFRAFPPNDPLITDVTKVDTSHPNNRAYVTYLASIGKLPEQVNAEKEKQEMATATVVDQLTAGYKDMADRVFKMAEDKVKAPPKTEASPETAISAAKGLMDAAGETMQKAAEMVMEQSKGMGLQEVLQVAKELKGGDEETKSQVNELTKMLLGMQKDQIDALNRRLDAMASAASTPATQPGVATAATDPFAYFDRGVEALKRMKSTVDELGGGNRAVDEAVDSAGGPAWLKTAAAAMPFVAQIFTGAVRAYELSRMAPGTIPPQPMQPMAPMTQDGTAMPNPSPAPTPSPSPTLTSLPAASTSPSPTSAPTDGLNVPALIYMIQAPLLNHLNMPELSGADFADWFIGGYGLEVFSQVKEYGPFLETALREHAVETKNGIIKPFNDISRLNQFVGEFLAFDPSKEE